MMGRHVQFTDTHLILHLTGFTGLFALKWKVSIDYRHIKNVFVDGFDAPLWMLRMPGTSIAPLHIYEGSFKYANDWYFLSYEKRDHLINMELDGHDKYKYVIFQIDRPAEVAADIRKRMAAQR